MRSSVVILRVEEASHSSPSGYLASAKSVWYEAAPMDYIRTALLRMISRVIFNLTSTTIAKTQLHGRKIAQPAHPTRLLRGLFARCRGEFVRKVCGGSRIGGLDLVDSGLQLAFGALKFITRLQQLRTVSLDSNHVRQRTISI